jgi:succinyl-diaminopimelate desuccinylase
MTLEHTLKQLISFKTVTGKRDEIERAFEWIKDELQPVPVFIREYDRNAHPILVITPARSKHVKLWLSAHIDVVPAADELFTPKIHGDRLIGRGAADMKFAIACYIKLLKELGTRIGNYDIGVMLTSDEEWGGHNGVKHLLEHEKYRGDVVFIPDGTGSWKFEEAAKGKWVFEVTSLGMPTHGSRPWNGRNAIHELVAYLNRFVDEFKQFANDTPDHWHASVSVGIIRGGESENVVAQHACAALDVRYTSEKELHIIKRLLGDLGEQYPHTSLKTKHIDPPYGISRADRNAALFARIAKERHGIDCEWSRACGASDARFFNWNGIATVLISPKSGDAHGIREWVDLPDLERYYDVLKVFVDEVAKK